MGICCSKGSTDVHEENAMPNESLKIPSRSSMKDDVSSQMSFCDDATSTVSCSHCGMFHGVAFPHEATAEKQDKSAPITLMFVCKNCLVPAGSKRSSVLATPEEEVLENTIPNQ